MASLEELYRIPPSHVLKLKFHRHGGGRPERWVHVEYDDQGKFVARYKSQARSPPGDGTPRVDWKKFDIGGMLVASGEDWPQQC